MRIYYKLVWYGLVFVLLYIFILRIFTIMLNTQWNFLSSIHRRSMTVIFKCTSFYSNSTLSQIRLSDFQSGATYQHKIPPFLSRCLLPTSSQFFFPNLCISSLHVKHNAFLITDGLIFHHLFSLFFAGKKGKGNNLKLLTSFLGLMVTQEKIKQCLKLTRYCTRTVRINLPDIFKTIKYNNYRRISCIVSCVRKNN